MEPFATLGIPSPAECPGILGLLFSVVAALVGVVWLFAYAGGLGSFLLIALAGLVGWVSFMYCVVWEGSWPLAG